MAYPASAMLKPEMLSRDSRMPRILCVDDDRDILELLQECLALHGFDVISECDAERARSLIQMVDFDALIVDYDMPGCNGLVFSKAIHKEKPRLPILMFSGTLLPPDSLTSISAFVAKNQGVMVLITALEHELSEAAVRPRRALSHK